MNPIPWKVLIVLNALFIFTTIAEFGAFKYVPKEVMECEGIETLGLISLSSTKISKLNRTTYTYNTTARFLVPFSDDLSLLIKLALWGNGGWKYNYFEADLEKMCESLNYYSPQFYNHMMGYFNVSQCPIPPGIYELINFPLPNFTTSQAIPSFEYGRYKVFTIVYVKEKILGCKGFIIDVIPDKKSKKKG